MRLLSSKYYYIWGTGFGAEQINKYYSEQLKRIKLLGYIDNDSSKWNSIFHGKKVFSPEVLNENRESYILIANTYTNDIMRQIIECYPWYKDRIVKEEYFFERLQIMTRYENCEESEIQDVISYLNNHPLRIFNAPFVEKYDNKDYNIEYDEEKGLYYILYYNKKMYFSRSFQSVEKVKDYYKSICIEQDESSPHRYLTNTFDVPDHAVVVDAGVAEGNFALSIVERIEKIYLFEPDNEWVEALRYTFEPYKEKVVIVNKCLSNYISDYTTTIDEILNKTKVDFIKMDVEGEEYYVIQGAEKSIKTSENIRCVVCTYHQELAHSAIKTLLESLGFKTETSNGYMWGHPDNYNLMRLPVLRRGLIRARKVESNEE